MTVIEWESKKPGCELSKLMKRTVDGYSQDYRDIYNIGVKLDPGTLVYVKDRYEDDWTPGKLVDYRNDEALVEIEDECESFWRYLLIPENAGFN